MKSALFLKEELKLLVLSYPEIKVSYQFDKISMTHLVEIDYIAAWLQKDKLEKSKFEITQEFITKFPSDCICWISDNEFVSIDEAEAIFVGHLYQAEELLPETILLDYTFDIPSKIALSESAFRCSFLTSLEFNLNISANYSEIIGGSIEETPSVSDMLEDIVQKISDKPLSGEAGESNYAMAA